MPVIYFDENCRQKNATNIVIIIYLIIGIEQMHQKTLSWQAFLNYDFFQLKQSTTFLQILVK